MIHINRNLQPIKNLELINFLQEEKIPYTFNPKHIVILAKATDAIKSLIIKKGFTIDESIKKITKKQVKPKLTKSK